MNDQRDRPIGELFRDLSTETATLVRAEVQLARVEIEEKLRRAGRAVPLFAVAAALGVGAFGAATACLIALLGLVVPLWAAALIVAAVYALVAFVLVRNGAARLREALPPVPEQTAQTLKEDIAWAKTRANSGAK
jgi:hypothetical protein